MSLPNRATWLTCNFTHSVVRGNHYNLTPTITSTQVAADRGALRIWRWVSLPEGGQKFWLQWQLADTAWLACARVAVTRSAAERPSNSQTQSYSLQRSHPHLNSIFVEYIACPGPTSLSYLYSSHSLTRSTPSGSCHSDGNYFTWPWKSAIIFVVEKLEGVI